jgi:hypothetical protein
VREFPWIVAVGAVALIVVSAMTAGFVAAAIVAFIALGLLAASLLGAAIATDVDRSWLPLLLPLAFMAKMAGSAARYYQVVVIYESGDAYGYHNTGARIAPIWRTFQVPEVTGGGFGTQITKQITGIIYTLGVPSMIGGFLIFAALAFIGTILFYLAFRRSLPSWGALPYFVLLFFLPTMLFWPSSTGKDALIVFGLGLISYGAALAFSHRVAPGIAILAAGGLLSGLIRPHIPVIALGAIALAMVASRAGKFGVNRSTRIVIMALATVALIYLVPLASARLGVDEGLETFLAEQERKTAQGGSAVVGKPVTSPLDLPEATLRVLFRPFPQEASSPGMLLSAAEGLVLLGIVIWRFPTMWGNRRVLRRNAYLLYTLGFTFAFVIAFSSIFNFGILARQRSQAVPFLLAVLVGLGWKKWSESEAMSQPASGEEINA